MKIGFRRRLLGAIGIPVLGLTAALSTAPANAVDVDEGAFELEGNALQDGAPLPDDWATLYAGGANNGGSPFEFTGIIDDLPDSKGVDDSIFTGGRKDIQDISNWGHKTGSSPDKDEITNAYAAAYNVNGDVHVYFGADRISNVGDAFMGFWFFKKPLIALADGSFQGQHTFDDVLALVNFPQGANASPEISVVTWDVSCTKAANNNPSVGECAAKNLRLRFKGESEAVCGGPGVTTVCAITNNENGPYHTTDSPWSFQSKNSDTADEFPYESFYEGGINLTQLIGGDSCFSSFLAETRSSSSFTATLKDWVIGDFELCSVDISKECGAGDINANEDGFIFPYDGVVTNDGSGTLYDIVVVDNNGTPSNTADDATHSIGTLAKGETATYSGNIESTQNPPTNRVDVYAASIPGGSKSVTDWASDECEGVNRDPMISVNKECSTTIIEKAGELVVQVNFMGQVCNTSLDEGAGNAISLINVSVTDDSGTPGDPSDDQVLFSGVTLPAADDGTECKSYSGSYLPGASAGLPGDLSFGDTVTARGQGALGFGSNLEETATATCPLCPTEEE